MATSQDKGFMEQLREMRNTRTQQLRQGSQQAGLLNKQISAITTLNKTMDAVLRAQNVNNTSLRDFNKKQDALIRQNNSVTQGIRNLSSTIDKSIGSLAKSVTSTKASEVKEIKQSKGVIKEDSGSSMMSSLLMKALPFAITGVIGKTMVWDNMDESVKKGLTDSFGNLVKSIFGGIDTSGLKKVTDPITKEFGIVFGALGDTFDSFSEKISSLVKRFEVVSDVMEKVGDRLKERGNNLPGVVEDGKQAFDRAAMKLSVKKEAATRTLTPVVESIKSIPSIDIPGTDISASQAAVAVGGVAAAAGGAKIAGSRRTARSGRMLTAKEIESMKKAVEYMKSNKLANNIFGLLAGRLLTAVGGGPVAAFVQAVSKYKLVAGGALTLLSAAVQYGLTDYLLNEVDVLYELGVIKSEKDVEYIRNYLVTESLAKVAGSFIVGTLGAVGGSLVAPGVGTVAGAVAGGYAGGEAAGYLARGGFEYLNPVPESLKDMSSDMSDIDKLYDRVQEEKNQVRNPGGRGKRMGAVSPSPASMTNASQTQITGYLIDFIKRKEGFRARPYGDYKQLSIGYGTKANSPDEVIDEKEAEKRMIEKLTGFQKTVLDYNSKYGYNWNQSQIDALTSFTYNAGEGNLKTLLGDGKRSNDEIAAKMKEYNKAGGKLNEGLVKRRGIEIAMFTGGRGSEPSYDLVDQEPRSLTFAENIARRRKEAKEAEKYEEGSETFVGPTLAKTETTKPSVLSAFAKQFSVESFTSDFAQKTKELTDVVNSMFAAQTQQSPTIVSDNSNVTNVINNSSGGSGGGPSINQVVSTHMSNMNWQFNSMSGGVRA